MGGEMGGIIVSAMRFMIWTVELAVCLMFVRSVVVSRGIEWPVMLSLCGGALVAFGYVLQQLWWWRRTTLIVAGNCSSHDPVLYRPDLCNLADWYLHNAMIGNSSYVLMVAGGTMLSNMFTRSYLGRWWWMAIPLLAIVNFAIGAAIQSAMSSHGR